MINDIPLWIICVVFIPMGILFFVIFLQIIVSLLFRLFDDDKPKTRLDSDSKEELVRKLYNVPEKKSSKTGWGGIPKGKKDEWWQ